MSEKFSRSLRNELAGHAAWELIKLAVEASIAIAGGLIGSRLLTLKIPRLAQLSPYLELLLALVGLLIFVALYQRLNRFRPRFPRLLADFRLLEKTITYEYFSTTKMRYTRKFRLKALRSGLRAYTDKYLWTGSGDVALHTANPEQQVGKTYSKNVWQMYEVIFEKTLRKGDVIDVEVVWDLEDRGGSAVPFFSTTVEEPTDLLRLNLSLAPALGITSVTREVSSGIGAMIPFESDVVPLDRHGDLSWLIDKPRLLHYYEIRWRRPQ